MTRSTRPPSVGVRALRALCRRPPQTFPVSRIKGSVGAVRTLGHSARTLLNRRLNTRHNHPSMTPHVLVLCSLRSPTFSFHLREDPVERGWVQGDEIMEAVAIAPRDGAL